MHDQTATKSNFKWKQIIIIIVKIIIIIKIGTFRQRLDSYVGSFLVIYRQIVAKPEASNGS